MAQHNNFKKDVDMLAEAYGSMHQSKEVVVESTDAPNPVEDNGEAAFKGGNIDHDWASHIEAPQFEGVKKILHHNLTEGGLIEEYYIEHNGKLAAVLAEDANIVMYESHGDEEEKHDEEEDDDEKDKKAKKDEEEEDEETIFGGASPAHGVKPRLQGVPLLK